MKPKVLGHDAYQRRYYAAADHATIQPDQTPYVRRHVDEVMGAAHIQPDDHILEVGAGLGRHARIMAERNVRVVASDFSPDLVAKHREQPWVKDGRVTPLVSGMADIADATPQRFSRAVGFFMLHHLEDLEGAFRGLAKVLRPGAVVAFCEPNAYHLPFYLQIALSPKMTWAGDRGVLNMRPRPVLGAMERAGFTKTKVTRFGFFPPLLANRPWGVQLERVLETIPVLAPVRAFQIFSARYGHGG